MSELSIADFGAFFREVHGHDPFPWQLRLAAQVASSGRWPRLLDLPTGSGKTAALDIALFSLALDASGPNRRAPLRTVFVVDRRTIVDQAAERAQKLVAALSSSDLPVAARVASRLSRLGSSGHPLDVATLRGGVPREDDWAQRPDQPLIVLSTVDQVGSRLLFRGYGVSDRMKPIHAGLLGNDALWLLDEVHLAQPLRETLGLVRDRYGKWGERSLGSRFDVVEMSATPGEDAGAFRLDGDDRADPILRRRLAARKPVRLSGKVKANGLTAELVKEAESYAAAPGATVAVVVNRVATAREVAEELTTRLGVRGDVYLITGRMRPLDREEMEATLAPRTRAGRTRDPAARPCVVVATQCIEAGADLDFDAMVTECASLDALRQRFGRLDRLGVLGTSSGVVVLRPDAKKNDPVYGDAIGATWEWLTARAERGELDFGIDQMGIAPAELAATLAPRASAPVLLPAHLDSWVQTAPIPEPDPEVSLWLHGPQRGSPDVSIVWRADISEELLRAAQSGDSLAAGAALAAVEALPPSSAEALPAPVWAVRRWLSGAPVDDVPDVEGSAAPNEAPSRAQRTDVRPALAWRGDASVVVAPEEIAPGDTLVVPSTYGGIAGGSWAPQATMTVRDIGEIAASRRSGRAMVRLHPAVLSGWLEAGATLPAVEIGEEDDERASLSAWLSSALASGQVERRIAALLKALITDERGFRWVRPTGWSASEGEGASEHFVLSGRTRLRSDAGGGDATTEDEQGSFTGTSVALGAHMAGVGEWARDFAARCGLPAAVVSDLALAGRWHDAGKADPRFQRLLHGGSAYKAAVAPELLAKSAASANDRSARERALEKSGYPRGARHEVTSVALMERSAALAAAAHDWELVLHLVASHHGHCRPLAPAVIDEVPVDVRFAQDGIEARVSSAHGLERLDSGIGDRFWRLVRRYGWWGLAWLEAILRLADHRRSEQEQRTGGKA